LLWITLTASLAAAAISFLAWRALRGLAGEQQATQSERQRQEQALENLRRTLAEEQARSREEANHTARDLREELSRLSALERAASAEAQERLRQAVDGGLKEMRAGNEAKLEQMRQTVEEKLQGTLDKRLGESFSMVSERLEKVHQGLGEMQALASGVGDLKRVLSNVKTRGIFGEIQLEALLSETLPPERYHRNKATKRGSHDVVEFALRLPGRGDGHEVLLPLDAKFPLEDYQRLNDALERGDQAACEEARKQLFQRLKGMAKDIRDKYLDPPFTTAFGLLFLPTESLYAEALRLPGLFDQLNREFRVNLCGPSTLLAFLSSLEMGFRTLAIEHKTTEVWQALGIIKTEFSKFGDMLDKAQKKIEEAGSSIADAARKSRGMEGKLKRLDAPSSAPAALDAPPQD
jgi:DNA recombination protein RmuC